MSAQETPRPPRVAPAAGGVTSTGQVGAPAPEGDAPPARPGQICVTCEHLDVLHDLSASKRRTRCSVSSGLKATPCGCRAFVAAT